MHPPAALAPSKIMTKKFEKNKLIFPLQIYIFLRIYIIIIYSLKEENPVKSLSVYLMEP